MSKANIKWSGIGVVLFVILLFLSEIAHLPQAAAGAGDTDIRQEVPLTPHQPNDEEDAVIAALQQALWARATAGALGDQPSNLVPAIQSITVDGEWAYAYLQPPMDSSQQRVNLATVALLRQAGQDDPWQVALPPTSMWQMWMKEIPPSMIDEPTKNYLLGTLVPSTPLAHYSGYKLPWSGGFPATIWCVLNNCTINGQSYHGYAAADFNIGGDYLVRAAKGGTVVFRKDTSPDTNRCNNASCWRWSNAVVIRHGTAEYSWYMHLAYNSIPANIQEGAWVEQGSVLGRQGCTGFCTAEHIHFMVATVMHPILSNGDPVTRMPNWPSGSYATFDFDEVDWGRLSQIAYNSFITSWNTGGSLPPPTPRPTTQPPPTSTPRPTQPPNPTATPLPTQPPPPNGSSIEIVSVSSHTVNPGESFNPAVTMRILSGQLLLSRGDHLHAVPEETTNTLGAWPVQSVRRAVNAGETYTFDVANDAGFRMTAPGSPGTYTSRWQLRVAGNHIGPVVEIPVTVRSVAPPPSPSGWRAQYWNGYYSDNPWGNGRCKADDYTNSIPFTPDWGSSGPGGGCSGERFSVLYERRFEFVAGRYRFHCHRDGYCRIFIPELGLTHAEEAGSFAGMDWGVDIPAGNWEVKIEYSHRRENGNARLEFWWQGPTSYLPPLDADCAASPYEWCGAYRVAWNSPSDSYVLRRLEGSGSLDHDWGSSGPGYGIYADFSGEWSRLAKFDAGLYRFHAIHDDGVKISVAGEEIMNEWGSCCREDTAEIWLPAGDHPIFVNWFDSGGSAVLKVWWEKITACYDLTITQDPAVPAGQITRSPLPNCPTNDTKYMAGSTVTLSATPPTDAEFVGWGGDVSSTSASVSLVVDYDRNIVARYSPCHSLQAATSADGRIETSPAPSCAGVGYRSGATVRVEAIPNAGQQFVRWRENLAGASNPVTLLMDANQSVAADYAAIPTAAQNAWYGEYFNNLTLAGDPVMVRNDPSLNFSWGNTSPAEPVAVDFSVRWTRSLSLAAGTYRFSLTHDDGMRLWIDGVLHADEWERCCRTDTVDVPLTAGTHTIVVEFVDLYGAAQAALAWENLATPTPATPTPATPPEASAQSIFLPVTLR